MLESSSTGRSRYGLDTHGIRNVNYVFWNMSSPALYESAVRRREGLIAHLGPLVVHTGHHTERSPHDKFIVREPETEDEIAWGEVNRPFKIERFDAFYRRLLISLQGKDLFVQDLHAGADPAFRVPIRVVTETAWHSLFARNVFVREFDPAVLSSHRPEFTVIHTPSFHAVPEIDGTNSECYILVSFARRLVLIGGTSYAGEIKKSVFTVLNYLMPRMGVFPMHCSANISADGEVALFFGRSGTGKTSLCTDPLRPMIGDDEHGWSERGVCTFEGGCYAKVISLSRADEPDIYETTRRFGTILENVMMDSETRRMNLDDDSLTENTRAAYPVTHLRSYVRTGTGGHPRNVVFLTLDAFGVLPPISRLTPEQAWYHFLSGYSARVTGADRGDHEPQATFSACFGEPFLPLPPMLYARQFGEMLARHRVDCWLVNTGWTGGPCGSGERLGIGLTRALLRAALSGKLASVATRTDPIFGLSSPVSCPDVPSEILHPRDAWRDKAAYDRTARRLAGMFRRNFEKFAGEVPEEIRAAGPAAEG